MRAVSNGCSRTTRCGCCARCGSRTSSASGSSRGRTTRPGTGLPGYPRCRRIEEGEKLNALRAGLASTRGARLAGAARWFARAGRPCGRDRHAGVPAGRVPRRQRRNAADLGAASGLCPQAVAERATRGRVAARDPRVPPPDEPWRWSARSSGRRGGALGGDRIRARQAAEPLLRGDELGLPPGPEIARTLERIAEERAAGTISTREEAMDMVRRVRMTVDPLREQLRRPPDGWATSRSDAGTPCGRSCGCSSLRRAANGCSTRVPGQTGWPSRSRRFIAEVVAVDIVPELLAPRAGGVRRRPVSTALRFVEGDATRLALRAAASIWPGPCARCTTSPGPSWSSRSSFA